MSSSAPATGAPSRLGSWAGRPRPTLVIAACAILPILVISLLARHWAARLQPLLPFEITNLAALKKMFSMFAHPERQGDDSWMPMQHALAVLQGPHAGALYETLFFGQQVRFQYPPTSLLWLELLSTLGVSGTHQLNALNAVVFLLNAGGVGALAWLLWRRASTGPAARGAPAPPSALGMGALAVGVSFLFYPVVRAGLLGQVQLWIDLLFTGALILWLVNRRLLAGVLIGLACTIKPQLGLLLLWGLLWRERGFVLGALGSLGLVGVMSLARYGLHNHLAYLQVLSFLSRHGESFFTNQSVNGILAGYLSGMDPMTWRGDVFTPFNPVVYAGTLAASILALVLIVVPPLVQRRRRAGLGDLGAATICTVIGSPVAWEHHYGLLLPLYLVGLATVLAQPAGVRRDGLVGVVLLSWVLTANLIALASLLAHTPWALLQANCFFGAIALLAVLLTVRPGPATPARAS